MIDTNVVSILPLFQTVAAAGNFSAAARATGISPSAMSQAIRRLEGLLGVRLFDRTSRNVALTEAGRHLMERLGTPLLQLERAIEEIGDDAREPKGHLRINLSRLACEICIEDRLAAFVETYPGVTLELSTEDSLVNIVRDGFDAGIRMWDKLELDMVARPIGPPLRRMLVASEAYVARYGRPRMPEDLFAHKVIRYRYPSSKRLEPITLKSGTDVLKLDIPAALLLDDNRVIRRAIDEGLGIAQRFRWTDENGLANGSLVELLPEYEPDPHQFHIYYPSRQRQPAKLTAFLNCFCRTAPSLKQ